MSEEHNPWRHYAERMERQYQLLADRYMEVIAELTDAMAREEVAADQARREEREACAKLCDEERDEWTGEAVYATRNCADAIRARGSDA